MANTVIVWTDAGTGTHTATFGNAGTYEGEYGHLQLTSEVGIHTHSGSTIVGQSVSATAGGVGVIGYPSALTLPVTVANNQLLANQTPFNITQPGTFYNIFIKL